MGLDASTGESGWQQIPRESHCKDSSQMFPFFQVFFSQTKGAVTVEHMEKATLSNQKSLGKRDNAIWLLRRELETMLALPQAGCALILPYTFLGHF